MCLAEVLPEVAEFVVRTVLQERRRSHFLPLLATHSTAEVRKGEMEWRESQRYGSKSVKACVEMLSIQNNIRTNGRLQVTERLKRCLF